MRKLLSSAQRGVSEDPPSKAGLSRALLAPLTACVVRLRRGSLCLRLRRPAGAAAERAAPRRVRLWPSAMVYFESWDEFFRQSEALYRAAPLRVRPSRALLRRRRRAPP